MAKVVYSNSTPGVIGSGLLPAKHNVVMYQGDDFSINLAFGSNKTSRVDMTGMTGSCQIRRTLTSQPIDSVITISEDGKKLNWFVGHETTSTMSGKYLYDLQLTETDGSSRTFLSGEVEVIPEVTKAG